MEMNHVSHRIAYEELKDMMGKGLLSMVGKGEGHQVRTKSNRLGN